MVTAIPVEDVVAWARLLVEGRAVWMDLRPSAAVGHRTAVNDAG